MIYLCESLRAPVRRAAFFLSIFGSIAMVSRTRSWPALNHLFKNVIGGEYQSWFEHGLSGFASPSLLFFAITNIALVIAAIPTNDLSSRLWSSVRIWISTKTEERQLRWWLAICWLIFVGVSLKWELDQAAVRGAFQYGQFSCDVSGAILWWIIMPYRKPERLVT